MHFYLASCMVITAVALANNLQHAPHYCLFFMVRTFKIYAVSSFQAYNTVLSAVIPMLCFGSLGRFYSSFNWNFVNFD